MICTHKYPNLTTHRISLGLDPRATHNTAQAANGPRVKPEEGAVLVEAVVKGLKTRCGGMPVISIPFQPRCHSRESGNLCFLCRIPKRRFPLSRE